MIGETLAHYRITAKLGEGGMGIVYRAEDTRLGRKVALKFLKPDLLGDEEHGARFLREARATAALDHPNICTLYEINQETGHLFLAMAFIDGQPLSKKTADGPLPVEEALEIGLQISRGLGFAHEKGVVHRDVKPANVMIVESGGQTLTKIMDFGLAHLSDSTTLTKVGAVMGSVAYMSPEQALGESVDQRTDIWALGVVLYEMITGRQPFPGDNSQAVIRAILQDRPEPVTGVRAGLPMDLEWILAKALEKDPQDRYPNAEAMMVDLRALVKRSESGASRLRAPSSLAMTATGVAPSSASQEESAAAVPTPKRHFPKNILLPLVISLLAVIAILAVWSLPGGSDGRIPIRRFSLSPEGFDVTWPMISPDGRYIAYVAGSVSERRLWIWDLHTEEAREIAPTDSPPLWSPDSRFVGFSSEQSLRKAAVAGGPPSTVCDVKAPDRRNFSGAWSADGSTIFFTDGWTSSVFEVPARGGEPKVVWESKEGGYLPVLNGFLAGTNDRTVLIGMAGESAAINLDTGEETARFDGRVLAPSSSGHILLVDDSALWALPPGSDDGGPVGDRFLVSEGGSSPSTANDGTLVFLEKPAASLQRLVWKDRQGAIVGEIGQPQEEIWDAALSPDGKLVAVRGVEKANSDIWIHHVARPIRRRVTFQPARDSNPIWSPDGQQILFASFQNSKQQMYVRAATGQEGPRRLMPTEGNAIARAWTADNRYLVYQEFRSETLRDLWYLERQSDGSWSDAKLFLGTPFEERAAKLSPDGRWIAYCSNESGRDEVYIKRFPTGEDRWQVSSQGGAQPRWTRDGKEIFFVEGDTLVAIPVTTRPEVSLGRPERLFSDPLLDSVYADQLYDVSADGERFVVVENVGGNPFSQIRVVQNWVALFANR